MPSTFPIDPTASPVQPVRLVLRGILPSAGGHTSAFLWNFVGFRPTLWPAALRDREVAAHGQACIGGPLEPRCHYAERITIEANRSLLSRLDSLVFRITAITAQ